MDTRVKTVIQILHQSLSKQLSIRALSKSVNLSPARLRELFKRDTGRSPLLYLRELRMEQAERLLRSTFLSVKEVAFFSGLRDVSHFARDFKKRHSVTPSEWCGLLRRKRASLFPELCHSHVDERRRWRAGGYPVRGLDGASGGRTAETDCQNPGGDAVSVRRGDPFHNPVRQTDLVSVVVPDSWLVHGSEFLFQ
jgi:AraC-like DNA-binding protein